MRFTPFAAAVAAASIPAAIAFANDRTVGAVSGAAVGALVGGPLGVLIGAGIGALIASMPPGTSAGARTRLAIGEMLPASLTYCDIPGFPDYAFVVLGDRRAIVDRRWRRVVRVIG